MVNPTDTGINPAHIIRRTQDWLEKAVIGLNLCPFAKAVHRNEQIRYVVSSATEREALADTLAHELMHLQETDPARTDTTLIIHPQVLTDFFDYNAFLPMADKVVSRLGLTGTIQIASFHPEYEFADCASDAIENYTNRSPYPMLHLLREASMDRAVAAFPEAETIYERNIETLRRVGIEGWKARGLASK